VSTFLGPPLSTETGIGALTLGTFLREVTDRHADREAIAFHPDGPDGAVLRWSYAGLADEAGQVARGLLATGTGKGERVAVLMGNRPEWVFAAYGVALAGAVLVPLNTWYEPPELLYVLQHADIAVLLVQRHFRGHDYLERLAPLRSPELPQLRATVSLGHEWDEFLAQGNHISGARLDATAADVSPDDDAVVVYTSGTTARPKGVLHAHRAPTLQAWRFARLLCLEPGVRTWSAFPFFWTAGFNMVMGATLAAGGCLVLQEHFEPGEALRLLEVERVTSPHAWPHQLAQLESHPDWETRDLSSLRHVEAFTSFGRHKTVSVDDGWSPRAAYGATETATIISALRANAPPEERDDNHGEILPGNAMRIIDPATGDALGVGQSGEIVVKGPTLMKGYVKAAPEDCFDADGFFVTGDAGFVDERGRLHWTGRTNDLIKTGGANVSPVEIEETLLRHPGLKAALAVGVPHPTLGEMVVVCAVAHDGHTVDEDDVRAFLRGRLASYKIPRRVVFVADGDLTLTGTAKIRTDELRVLASRLLEHGNRAE
jgi:acyl-CoA synthetase (AMP-forming)/AMP-acid ligase II